MRARPRITPLPGLLHSEYEWARIGERLQTLNGKLDQFLASVEKSAFRIAEIALRNREDALDVVQEAMIKLVEKYADKPDQEWKPLFFSIMRSRITDQHRRRTLQKRLFGWISPDAHTDGLIEEMTVEDHGPPDFLAEQSTWESLVAGLQALPQRQQQAFLLRTWQGFSVEDTSKIMKCSAGSVKTHLSRATHSLKNLVDLDN